MILQHRKLVALLLCPLVYACGDGVNGTVFDTDSSDNPVASYPSTGEVLEQSELGESALPSVVDATNTVDVALVEGEEPAPVLVVDSTAVTELELGAAVAGSETSTDVTDSFVSVAIAGQQPEVAQQSVVEQAGLSVAAAGEQAEATQAAVVPTAVVAEPVAVVVEPVAVVAEPAAVVAEPAAVVVEPVAVVVEPAAVDAEPAAVVVEPVAAVAEPVAVVAEPAVVVVEPVAVVAEPVAAVVEQEELVEEVTGGTVVSNSDWTVRHPENVKFGDHDADAGYEPSTATGDDAIRVTLAQGSHYGTGTYFDFPSGIEEAWVSYCMRFSSNWNASVGGKLPGFSGNSSPTNGGQGGNPSTGDNAWSARMLYGSFDTAEQAVPMGFYVYHSAYASSSIYGDAEWWAPAPGRSFSSAARAKSDRWYTMKQHVKLNTKNQADGLLEAWVDGELVYQRDDFNFTNNDEFREVYRLWLDIYHGGAETAASDQFVYFDQFNYSVDVDTTGVSCS